MNYKDIEQFYISKETSIQNVDEIKDNILSVVPESKFRIYAIVNLLNNLYFKNEEKLERYIKHSKRHFGQKVVIDYLGHMAGRVDVIRVTYSDDSVKYFSEENDLGYMIYNQDKSKLQNEDVWDYEYGDLKDVYDELKRHGIVLENDVYGRQDALYASVSDKFVEPLKRK